MTTSSTTCPFCNAVIGLPEWLPPRMICPRCSESFVPQLKSSSPSTADVPTLGQEIDRHRQARPTSSKRRTAIWFAGIAVLLGTGVALRYFQRPRSQPNVPPDAARVYTPEDTPALKYLPPGTDSVIVLHLQPMLGLDSGASKADIRAALTAKGFPIEIADFPEKNLGLAWDQIDQLAMGAQLKRGLDPDKLVAVLHLRTPMTEEVLAEQMHAGLQHDRKLHRKIYQTRSSPTVYGWLITPQLLAVGLSPDILQRMPEIPYNGLDHLDSSLVESIRTGLPRESFTWAVLQSEKFGAIVNLAALVRRDLQEWQDPVDAMRAVVIAVTPGATLPQVVAAVEMKNKTTAQGWREGLQNRFEGHPEITVGGKENKVIVGLPLDPAQVRIAVGKR